MRLGMTTLMKREQSVPHGEERAVCATRWRTGLYTPRYAPLVSTLRFVMDHWWVLFASLWTRGEPYTPRYGPEESPIRHVVTLMTVMCRIDSSDIIDSYVPYW